MDHDKVTDSTNEPSQDDNVKNSINEQPKEAIDSKSQAHDAATNAAPLPPSRPSSPSSPTMSPTRSPQQPQPMRPTAAAAPRPRPPPQMPFGPFMMPVGLAPPFYNQQMMLPPPPYFQFSPYGQTFMPYGHTMIPYPPKPWATGPFDCFADAKNCCLTSCCPCVTFGQIAEILNEGQTPWWEHAMAYFVLDYITLSVGSFLYAWPYRAKMRTKFWLRGKLLWDFIFTFFCTRASLCQQYRQLSRVGFDVPLGWEANKEKMRMKTLEENMYQMHNLQLTPPPMELGMYR